MFTKSWKCLGLLLPCCLACCLAWGSIGAAELQVLLQGAPAGAGEARMSLLGEEPGVVRLRVSVGGFGADRVFTSAGEFTQISFAGRGFTTAVGRPKLPVIQEWVEIPAGSSAEVVFAGGRYEEHSLAELGLGAPILPLQEPLVKTPEAVRAARFVIDEEAYASPGWYPAELFASEPPVQLRNHRLISLRVSPIQFDPARGLVRCYSEIELEVRWADAAAGSGSRLLSPLFERLAASTILNYRAPAGGEKVLDLDVGYLVISNDDFAAALAPLTDWKTKMGFKVTLAGESDMTWTTGGIWDYIKNAYDTWPVPPTGVLLVGDDDYLPAYGADAYGGVTDLYFATLAGSDSLPDIFYSRLPARAAADVTAMVQKTLDYERVENLSGTFYDDGAFLAASDMYEVGEGTQNYVISTFFEPAGVTCFKIYERLGGDTADITENLNAGRTVCIYTGHGSSGSWSGPGFTKGNIDALANAGMYPFVNSHACNTGDYSSTECFGEAWVKRANKGAIAFWGSVPSTYWDEDDWLEREAWEEHFANHLWTFGELTNQAKINLWGMTGANLYYMEGYNLFGDWSTALWTAIPATPAVTHPATIPMGPSDVSVTVRVDGNPVEGALVCILQEGRFHSAAYTGASGTAVVSCNPATAEPCAITVTGRNLEIYEGSIPVGEANSHPLIVTGPGPDRSNPCLVRGFRPQSGTVILEEEFTAYPADRYGVLVAAADIDGDYAAEILTGPGPGPIFGPQVRAFEADGAPVGGGAVNFFAYGTHRYGVNVCGADLDGDQTAEIVTGAGPGPVCGPHVRAFHYSPAGGSVEPVPGMSFFAYAVPRWGVRVTGGDVDGDGMDEILTAPGPGPACGGHVRGFDCDGGTAIPMPGLSFLAGGYHCGATVACGDLDGDGRDEILTGPGCDPAAPPQVRGWEYSGTAVTAIPALSFLPYGSAGFGVVVACGDLDGDGIDEILTAPGPGPAFASHVRGFNYDGTTLSPVPGISFFAYDPATVRHGGQVAAGAVAGE